MITLLKAQLKENRSVILFCLIAPVVVTFFQSLIISGPGIMYTFPLIPFVALGVIFSYIFLSLSTIYKDYQIHYGDHASFYSTIPLSSKEVTGTRFLYYLVINIFSFISFFCVLMIFFLSIKIFDGFPQIMLEAGRYLKQISLMNYALMFLYGIFFLFHSISLYLVSVSLGGEKLLRKLGIFGPVLVYIGLSILESILNFVSTQLPWTYAIIHKGGGDLKVGFESSSASQLLELYSKEELISNLPIFTIIFTLILTGLYLYRTYISHKKKMSVY